mmetsp:Transcript_29233/g.59797  ORF Transcript_29233/g.59797 Transcript_29233/m.59797 type:complete len:605 (+) Transcript_29233:42-1856(+)|eukprot:CAMPEP_0171717354 /NCGR_PEP_ID=MMETSP0991-20121206/19978_1 /TAXON_ID=483369 /ORGANISM="non described non described, Strain CCMP2098" /LENGTH=604 /DNA_ID=CAMNT_0012308545 /DNA_START=38 /DNA_END=1852 /DNA_ORIENTATION=+
MAAAQVLSPNDGRATTDVSGTSIVDDETSVIIHSMLAACFGMLTPKDFQLSSIFILAFKIAARLLVVQKTGAGKSLLILGAAAILRGVIIVVEPLLAVGSDQARASSEKGAKCFHIDGLDNTTKARIIKMLMSMTSKCFGPIILYMSPLSIQETCWVEVVSHLFENGLVTLVALDEIHKAVFDGREFRPEFAALKNTLWGLAKKCLFPVAMLSMTATLTEESLRAYKEMMGIDFDYSIWGDVRRDEVKLFCDVHVSVTKQIKAVVLSHLVAVTHRKVIVYTNDAKAARESLLSAMQKTIQASQIDGDVLAVTGASGIIQKSFVIEAFASATASEVLDLRIVTATSAFNCGVSSPYCGACVYQGFPESVESYAQILGRPGRVPLSPGSKPYEFHVILSVALLTFLLIRIAFIESVKERNLQYADALEVLSLLVLSDGCIHDFLERRFGNPFKKRQREDEGGRSAGCGGACWVCSGSATAKAISRTHVISILSSEAFRRGKLRMSGVVKILYKFRARIWGTGANATNNDVNRLVLQLVAAKILYFDVKLEPKESKEKTAVLLSWYEVATESTDGHPNPRGYAYSNAARWLKIKQRDDDTNDADYGA